MFENVSKAPVAIVSDLHANWEASRAVFQQIKQKSIKPVICLGDVVGYGPDPEKVVDLVRKNCDLCIMGNHDWGLLRKPYGFSPVAKEVIEFTQERMRPKAYHIFGRRKNRWDYVGALEKKYQEGDIVLVHGSVRDSISEYVYPDKMRGFNPYVLEEIFQEIERLCFCGHTHHPCVIREDTGCWYPQDDGDVCQLANDQKYIINVGSVGQPRDGDARACYVTFTGNEITYHRVEYDVASTIAKIRALGWSEKLVERLQATSS